MHKENDQIYIFLTGKCSHGSFRDFPFGINKDFSASCHGLQHNKSADLAIDASVQLLEEIRNRSDDLSFFRYTCRIN